MRTLSFLVFSVIALLAGLVAYAFHSNVVQRQPNVGLEELLGLRDLLLNSEQVVFDDAMDLENVETHIFLGSRRVRLKLMVLSKACNSTSYVEETEKPLYVFLGERCGVAGKVSYRILNDTVVLTYYRANQTGLVGVLHKLEKRVVVRVWADSVRTEWFTLAFPQPLEIIVVEVVVG